MNPHALIFDLNPSERKIFEIVSDAGDRLGIPVYAIGGFVRDRLIGRPCKDIDIVCQGDGILLALEVAGQFRPVARVNFFERFGTAMIKYEDIELEFVGARKESYSHDSRKPLVSPGTLQDDQLRRDFTINAISISLNKSNYGEIIDPFQGLDDLEKKILRTPTDPDMTFSDDPLRMLRAIRFASQLLYEIDDRTWQGIIDNKDRIRIVSQERITNEFEKIILSPIPSIGFDLLFKSGLLDIIFPEFTLLHGVAYQDGKGHKDNFYHTLQVLDNLSEKTANLWLRWSAILHDIAKPQTKRFDPEIGWTFHGHEALGAIMVPRIFKKMRLPLDHKMKYVQKLVRLHLRPIALTQEEITDSALRRLLFDAGEDIDDLLMLCEADITSKNPEKVKKFRNNYSKVREKLAEVEENDRIRNWQPPITGEMIMTLFKLKPGREVGILKNTIREAILDGLIPNDYDAALNLLKEKANELGIVQVHS